MGTPFHPLDQRGLARVCDWWTPKMNKGNTTSRGQSPKVHCVRHGLPRISRSQQQTVWPRAPLGGASEDYVLGPLLPHHGQAEEGGAGI